MAEFALTTTFAALQFLLECKEVLVPMPLFLNSLQICGTLIITESRASVKRIRAPASRSTEPEALARQHQEPSRHHD